MRVILAQDFERGDESSDKRDVINILYWGETGHFYLICNLKALIMQVNFSGGVKKEKTQKICYVCMNLIDTRRVDIGEHVKFCRDRSGKQRVVYPEAGKNDTECFKDYRLNNKLLIFATADGECSLLPIKKPDNDFLENEYGNQDEYFNNAVNRNMYENAYREQNFPLNGGSTNGVPVHVHRLNSLGSMVYVSDEVVDFPRLQFVKEVGEFKQIMIAEGDCEQSEEKLVDRFMDYMNNASRFLRKWLVYINDPKFQSEVLKKLRNENIDFVESCTHCIYCRKVLPSDPQKRHLDHCHLTRKLRGMSCFQCNMTARMEKSDSFRLLIYFHNFSGYDSSFLVRYMKRPKIEENVNFVKGRRDRQNQRVWKCRMSGQKIHQLQTNLLEFRDSYDIVPVSIATLSENLPMKYLKHVQPMLWEGEDPSKNIYPYEWVSSIKRFSKVNFPTIGCFESLLTGKIAPKDFEHSKKLYDVNCSKFRDWHVHYLEMDVLILLDSLLFWQGTLHTEFGVDLLRCHSLPSCAKYSMLNHSRVSLKMITDPSISDLFAKSIKGGLCVTSLRSYRVKDQSAQSIRYFDIKSLYASIQKLYRHPVGGYRYLAPVPSPEDLLKMSKKYDEKTASTGYLCIVDLKIPHSLHNMLSDFPVTFSKTSVDPKFYPPTSKWRHLPKSRVTKLIPSLFDPKNYGVSMLSLKFLTSLGIAIEKVHNVIAFEQEYFLRDFIDICLKKRKESGLKMDDKAFKLMANGLFGKFIEDVFKYSETKFVFEKADYDRLLRKATRFISAKFERYGVLMQNKPSSVFMNKCIAVGFSILCKSKAHFQKLFYFDILPAYERIERPITFENRIRVMYVDTDSILLLLTLNFDEEMEFYSRLRHIFDFSTLPTNDRFYSKENSSTVGIFKDEIENGLLIKSQHSNGAKSYVYTIENNTGVTKNLMTEKEKKVYYPNIKLKALSKFFQSTLLREEDFLNAFKNPNKETKLTYTALRMGHRRRMYTIKCTRKLLDSHDSKRFVHPLQLDSLALGHHLTLNPEWVGRLMMEGNAYKWPDIQ